jgi:addiction module HigA family antidote
MDLSQNRLARELAVPPRRINEIVLGKRSITPDTALRLARYFGTSERFWLGLQADFDLEEARLNLAGRIEREITPRKSAVAG